MVLGDGPLSQVTFVTCGNQSKSESKTRCQGNEDGSRREKSTLKFPTRDILCESSRVEKSRNSRKSAIGAGFEGSNWENSCGKLRRDAARLRSNLDLLLFGSSVQGGNSTEGVRNFVRGRLRQILVSGKVNRHSQLGSDRGLDNTQHGSLATNAHAFAQRDFGWHQQRYFDGFSDSQREVGKEERSLRAEILRKSARFVLCPGQSYGNRDMDVEALSAAAFQMIRGGHVFLEWRARTRPRSGRDRGELYLRLRRLGSGVFATADRVARKFTSGHGEEHKNGSVARL